MVQVGPRAATSAAIDIKDAPPAEAEAALAPADVEVEEPPRPQRRRYSIEIPIDPEYLPFLALMLFGLVL
ncbi:MAG: hypothetical protein JOZ65_24845, partial [Chloroflexi bacterium]|nr:hypothetical protein [Chloroflexota bacterium]